jgi:hypothetical protein
MGHTVAHLVEALRAEPEDRGSSEFFIDLTIPAVLWSWRRLRLQQKLVPVIFPEGREVKAAGA